MNNPQMIDLGKLAPNMGIGVQVNMTERALEIIIVMNGHPVPNGGVRLTVPQAREHIGKMMAALQFLEQQQQSALILPPGVVAGRKFQP